MFRVDVCWWYRVGKQHRVGTLDLVKMKRKSVVGAETVWGKSTTRYRVGEIEGRLVGWWS
jgi:hypothetical protein